MPPRSGAAAPAGAIVQTPAAMPAASTHTVLNRVVFILPPRLVGQHVPGAAAHRPPSHRSRLRGFHATSGPATAAVNLSIPCRCLLGYVKRGGTPPSARASARAVPAPLSGSCRPPAGSGDETRIRWAD